MYSEESYLQCIPQDQEDDSLQKPQSDPEQARQANEVQVQGQARKVSFYSDTSTSLIDLLKLHKREGCSERLQKWVA